jgi:hypothetical protein
MDDCRIRLVQDLLEPIDIAEITALLAISVLALYLLLRPRRPRLPLGIGRELEERVESLLTQFRFNYEDRRKASVSATPDFLVMLPNGKVGLEVKNVNNLSEIQAPHHEKVIVGCKSLDAIPLYVVGLDMNYTEKQGIPVIPIQSIVPVLMLLGQSGNSLEFKDELGVRQSIEELLQFENRFRILFDELRKVRNAFEG